MLDLDARVRRGGFELALRARLDSPVTAVFGPSGAGKTTLLHLVVGLLRCREGRVALSGVVLDEAGGAFVPPHRRRIGVVFQEPRLFPNLTVEKNLRFGERYVPAGEPRPALDEVADVLALTKLLPRPVYGLSGGEAKRVALGRALLCSPRLLLLDEPLSGLDLPMRRQVLPFLRRALDEFHIPALVVSHDLSELLELTDRFLVILDGRLAGDGTLAELVSKPGMVGLFSGHGLENVLRGTVSGHEEGSGVTWFEPSTQPSTGAPRIKVPWSPSLPTGEAAVVSLRPQDVLLAVQPLEGTSLQNRLRARVTALVEGSGRVIAVMDAGVPLLAEVTRRAAADLELKPGMDLWCAFKTSAVRVLDCEE